VSRFGSSTEFLSLLQSELPNQSDTSKLSSWCPFGPEVRKSACREIRAKVGSGSKQQTAGVTDIVAVAKGAGIANSHWVRDGAHFMQLPDRRFAEGGSLLLAVKIDDKPGPIQYRANPTLIRSRFMKGLGTGRGVDA
jgi:hypothetical protein